MFCRFKRSLALGNAYPIDQHLLGESGRSVGIAWPGSADGNVEDEEKRVLVHPRCPSGKFSGRDFKILRAIDKESYRLRRPFHAVNVEVVGPALAGGQTKGTTDAVASKVTGAMHRAVDAGLGGTEC